MKKTLLIAAVSLVALSANAMDIKQYASLKANFASMQNDVKFTDQTDPEDNEKWNADDKVPGFSLAYGLKMNSFRTELEANWNDDAKKTKTWVDDSVKQTVKASSLMLNGYYDINTNSKFTPYVGAGIGLAKLKAEYKDNDSKHHSSDTNFAWQVGAGISYAMTDNWGLDLGYRYMDNGDTTCKLPGTEGEKVKMESKSHNVSFGIRYTF